MTTARPRRRTDVKAPKASPWILGTAVLSLAILGLAWLLAIAPQLARAAERDDEAAMIRQQNEIHEERLATLEEQSEHLEDYKAELASLQIGIPTTDGEPAFLREVAAAAAATGVTVVSTTFGLPEEFFSAAALEEPAAPADATNGDDPTANAGDAEVTDASPDPIAGVSGLAVMPTQVIVLGTYDNTVAFMERLQTAMSRLYLVTGYAVTGQKEAEPSGGRPATHEGDAELLIDGFMYVLAPSVTPASSGGSTGTDESGTDEPLS
jgi:hypothetical protein